MNLDDLMAVWRSQDAAPIHGVNETLLRLALQQDEAKVQKARRFENRITYLTSAFIAAMMAFLSVLMFGMLFFNDGDVVSGWDFIASIVGVAAAAVLGGQLYMARRTQAHREQVFGDSLRDRVGRSLAQVDFEATTGVWRAGLVVVAGFVGASAIVVAGIRVNMEPDELFDWRGVGRGMFVLAVFSALGYRAARRAVQREILPRKRQLEGLLDQLNES